MKTNQEIVDRAKKYLLSFEEINETILDSHLKFPKDNKPINKEELYKKLLFHATNRQGLAHYIGEISSLEKILFSFSAKRVLEYYKNWEQLFDTVEKEVNPPGRMEKSNNKNSWVLFTKIILSMAEYVERFKNIESYYSYIELFISSNADVRLGLPLILSEEVKGFGFALACDFIKENISPYFVKPDTHIRDIFIGIGLSKRNATDFQVFRDVIEFSNTLKILPYEIDKLFWLIGSGNFYNEKIKVKSDKNKFIREINSET